MRTWALLLAGPVLWLAHFMVVYLAVEAGCAAGVGDGALVVGLSALALFTLATTVAAATASVAIGLAAYGRWSPECGLATAALVLGAIFAFAILLVGIPALWVGPC